MKFLVDFRLRDACAQCSHSILEQLLGQFSAYRAAQLADAA